jgi:hypothetical protein
MTISKVGARNMYIYIYICLQFEELFSHLSVPVLFRESMSPTLSGSTSEHRGSTRFHTQHRVATRANLQTTRCAYTLSSTSLSHFILISLLSIVPGSYFTRKKSPVDLVACYYFTICRISVDTTAL